MDIHLSSSALDATSVLSEATTMLWDERSVYGMLL